MRSLDMPALPDCSPPPRIYLPSVQGLPVGTCDTHLHVFGEQASYPLAVGRGYTPHVCTLEHYRRMMNALGIQRAVLVQPSVYGVDNRALLDALRAGGAPFRGVVVPPADIADQQLQAMHDLGVRGIRLNLVNPHVLSTAVAIDLCHRVRHLGWHLQLQIRLTSAGAGDGISVPQLRALADRVPVPLVIDHMGRPDALDDVDAFIDFFARSDCWVKLSAPYRLSRQPWPYEDVSAFAQALIGARAGGLLWGSDWPHTELAGAAPQAGSLADLVNRWTGDPAIREAIFVDNPARLYGFY